MPTVRGAPEAICADFDGTLAETRLDFGRMRQGVEALARGFGLRDGGPTPRYVLELIAHYAAELGEGSGAAARFRGECLRHLEGIELAAAAVGRPYPGVAEAMAELQRRGICLGVVTRNSRVGVEAFLRRHPLPCDALITRDDVIAVKPHPEHLRVALQAMGCGGDRALMVGDHPTDMQCAAAAGLAAVGVLTSGSGEAALRAGGATLVIPSFGHLLDHLG
jgi:HAD superfamily hydrolase (TIGR01549 family)